LEFLTALKSGHLGEFVKFLIRRFKVKKESQVVFITINSIPLKCPKETLDAIKDTDLNPMEIDGFLAHMRFQVKDKDGNQSTYEFN